MPRRLARCNAAAIGQYQNIEAVGEFGRKQRLTNIGTGRFIREIMFEGPVIDRDLAFTGPQEYARRRGLATTGSQLLD